MCRIACNVPNAGGMRFRFRVCNLDGARYEPCIHSCYVPIELITRLFPIWHLRVALHAARRLCISLAYGVIAYVPTELIIGLF